MHHFVKSPAYEANIKKQLEELDQMVSDAEKRGFRGTSNFLDNIWTPLIIFIIFCVVGCVLGYINFERTHRRRLNEYHANRQRLREQRQTKV